MKITYYWQGQYDDMFSSVFKYLRGGIGRFGYISYKAVKSVYFSEKLGKVLENNLLENWPKKMPCGAPIIRMEFRPMFEKLKITGTLLDAVIDTLEDVSSGEYDEPSDDGRPIYYLKRCGEYLEVGFRDAHKLYGTDKE